MKANKNTLIQSEYLIVADNIKKQIFSTQSNVFKSINRELINLYFNIGKTINDHKTWGNKFIFKLSNDIHAEFPSLKGFSPTNLKYMAKFAKFIIGQTASDQLVKTLSEHLNWSQIVLLTSKFNDVKTIKYYISSVIENNWSYRELKQQVNHNLHNRPGKITNFTTTLESPQKEQALALFKDPYIFDFIESGDTLLEKEIENELVNNVTKLLLSFGKGFTFAGQQYKLKVSNKDFYIDLLFYNTRLHCFIVIELKASDFKPEYVGQLNFYCSVIDSQIKTDIDKPTIGILLCKNKDNLVAEYSLKDVSKPIGISEYKTLDTMPEELKGIMPNVKELELRLKSDFTVNGLERK
jgi:predicted nuclease of restriction endonuclease-like (RecB) superfamily